MEKRDTPITVRPRKGSELEAVWLECQKNMATMRELIHAWAGEAKSKKGGE